MLKSRTFNPEKDLLLDYLKHIKGIQANKPICNGKQSSFLDLIFIFVIFNNLDDQRLMKDNILILSRKVIFRYYNYRKKFHVTINTVPLSHSRTVHKVL